MKIYKYNIKNRPGCVEDGGYLFQNDEALGFGTEESSQYEISTFMALYHGTEIDWISESGTQLSTEEKYNETKSTLEYHGITVSSGDESAYQDWITSDEKIAIDRRKEYVENGITSEVLAVALWEKYIEGKSDEESGVMLIQDKREEIKIKNPKKE